MKKRFHLKIIGWNDIYTKKERNPEIIKIEIAISINKRRFLTVFEIQYGRFSS